MRQQWICAAAFAALFTFWAVPGTAQDAYLTSRDGSISLEGTMQGFDGEFYRLSTEFGIITVDAEGVSCEGPGCPDLVYPIAEIRFAGDRSMGQTLMPALVETFAAQNALAARRQTRDERHFSYLLVDPTKDRLIARFHFKLTDSADGIADLIADRADFAMTHRAVTTEEAVQGVAGGIGNLSGPRRSRIVALDALVPIVSKRNPLRQISVKQVQAIRSGMLTDWSELGGPELPVELHELVPSGSVAQHSPVDGAALPTERSALRVRHESAAELADTVSRRPDTLGLARYSDLGTARPLSLVGSCGRQISASPEALKAEEYPLALPLYLYVPLRRLPLLAREFLAWLNTPSAEMAVRRSGLVDQRPVEIPLAAQGERLAFAIASAGDEISLKDLQEVVTAVTGASRLTATFRFRNGSSFLDPQSEGNLDRLARDIEIGTYDDREIILAGFSDGQGGAEANRALSLQRAEAVANALRVAAPAADWKRVKLDARGFGEALPQACDDTEAGRRSNRRVEVWLR